mmetsp:Transcript_18312/g.41671  ORF Transcript_18312/g.41671 Transcript_18312/m.41671 type:complete len:1326 (-) Transcript_18312:79-4056(-)
MKSVSHGKRSQSPTPIARASLPERSSLFGLEGISSTNLRSVSPVQTRGRPPRASTDYMGSSKARKAGSQAQEKRSNSPIPRALEASSSRVVNAGNRKLDYPPGPGSVRISKSQESPKVQSKAVLRSGVFRKCLRQVLSRTQRRFHSELFFERWLDYMTAERHARMKENTSAFILAIRSQCNKHYLEAYFVRWVQQMLSLKSEDLNLRMKASDDASKALVDVVNERTRIVCQDQREIEVYEHLVDKKLRSEEKDALLSTVFSNWKHLQQLARRILLKCVTNTFKHWNLFVRRERYEKNHCMVERTSRSLQRLSHGAEILMEKRSCRQFLHSVMFMWDFVAKANKFFKKGQATIRNRRVARQTLIAFEALCYHVDRSQRERYLTRYQDIMLRKESLRMQKTLMKHWQTLVRRVKMQKWKFDRVLHSTSLRLMHRCIEEWRSVCCFEKNARARVGKKRREEMRNAWTSWRMEFESTRENQLTCRGWQRDIISHMRREILVHWRMSCLIGRIETTRAKQLQSRRLSSLQGSCFGEWSAQARERSCRDKRLQRRSAAQKRRRALQTFHRWSLAASRSFKLPSGRVHQWAVCVTRKLVLRVLSGWQEQLVTATRMRMVIRDRTMVLLSRAKKNLFKRWKVLVGASNINYGHAVILVRKQRRVAMKECFRVWMNAREERCKLLQTQLRGRRLLLTGAMSSWRSRMRTKEKRRRACLLFHGKLKFSRFISIFKAWSRKSILSRSKLRACARAEAKRRYAFKYKMLMAFKVGVLTCVILRNENLEEGVAEPLSQVMYLPLDVRKQRRRMFEGWKSLTVQWSLKASKLDHKLSLQRSKLTELALLAWFHLCSGSNQVRNLSRRIRTRESGAKRRSSFLQWRELCDRKFRQRMLVERSILARKELLKRKVYVCWITLMSQTRMTKSLLRSCFAFRRRKILREYVTAWSAFSAKQLRLFHQERRIVRKSQTAIIKRSLVLWIRCSVSKHLQPVLEKFVCKRLRLLLKIHIDQLKDYHLRSRKAQSTVECCQVRKRHKLLHNVLARWAKETTKQESLHCKVKSLSMMHGWRLASRSFKSLLGNSRARSRSLSQPASHNTSLWEPSLVQVCSPLFSTPQAYPPAPPSPSPFASNDLSGWAIEQLSLRVMKSAMRAWRSAVDEAKFLHDFAEMWNKNCEGLLGKLVVCFYSWHRIAVSSRYDTEEASSHATNELQKRLLLLVDVKHNSSRLFLHHHRASSCVQEGASGSELEENYHPLSSSSTASTLSQNLEHSNHYPLNGSGHSDTSPGNYPFHDLYVSCFPRNDVNYGSGQIKHTVSLPRVLSTSPTPSTFPGPVPGL